MRCSIIGNPKEIKMLESVSNEDLEKIINSKNMSRDFRSLAKNIMEKRRGKLLRPITLSNACLNEDTEVFGYMINELSKRLGNSFLYGDRGRSGGVLGISIQTFNRWSEDNFETMNKRSMARVVAAYNMIRKWRDGKASPREITEKFEHEWNEFQKETDRERKVKQSLYFGIV